MLCVSKRRKGLSLPRVILIKMASNRKKLDNRIRILIENGMASRHRTFFVIVGDKGRDQVKLLATLHGHHDE